METQFTIILNPKTNLVHIPVADSRFKTVGNLYAFLIDKGVELQMIIYYNTDDKKFQAYGKWSKMGGPEDLKLQPDTGLIITLKDTAEAKKITFQGPMYEKTDVPLKEGINLVGLPVDDSDIVTLNDLTDAIGANFKILIAQNEEGKFVSSIEVPDLEITGSDAFIVTVSADTTLELEGEPWSKSEVPAKPAIPIADRDWSHLDVIVVQGTTVLEKTYEPLSNLNVTVRNLSTGISKTDISGRLTKDGKYSVVFVNLSGSPVAEVGNIFRISAEDSTGMFGVESVLHKVTKEDIKNGVITFDLSLTKIPEHSSLMQNYPNPFNPETWIPFQLAESANVVISIYNIDGELVRKIELGDTPAGVYVSKDRAAYWNGCNSIGEKVSSGIYFYNLQACPRAKRKSKDYNSTKRMLILK